MQPLARYAGYEIGRDGDVVWMAHRRTRAPLLVALIAAGLTLIAGANAILWSVTSFSDGETGTAAVLIAVFLAVLVVFGGIATLGYRAYRRRARAPLADVARVRADLAGGELQTPAGERIADLADVRIDTPFNLGDSTLGAMRWVRLRWPDGSLRVATNANEEARRIAAVLAEWGVGRIED